MKGEKSMRELNPNKDNSQSVRSWHSNNEDNRIGFIMRDAQSTSVTSMPLAINPLGRNIGDVLSKANYAGTDRNVALWRNKNELSTSGLMTFHFEPVIAPQSKTARQITEDIFQNRWSAMKLYNTDVKQWQPADIHIIAVTHMLIEMHLANIERCFDVMAMGHDAQNAYYNPHDMLKALGFDYSDFDIKDKYFSWINFYNQDILGSLNSVTWMNNLFPGWKRWAAMCSDIFKDTSADTKYCQLYAFVPRSFWMLELKTVPGSQSLTYWQLTREEMPTDFTTYLQKVKALIRACFYDDDALDIQSSINAIVARRPQDAMANLGLVKLKYDEYPITGRSITFAYDWRMLLAIHNASIMLGLHAGNVTQDPNNGRLLQSFGLEAGAWPARTCAQIPKIINLPNFGATPSDLINATQWTVIADPTTAWNANVPADAFGSDVIVDAKIWYYTETGNDDPTLSSRTFSNFIHCVEYSTDDTAIHCLPLGDTLTISQISQFEFAPIVYILDPVPASGTVGPDVLSTVGELEVTYALTYTQLSELKRQYCYNFWGYPINVASPGTPSFGSGKAGDSPTASAPSRI